MTGAFDPLFTKVREERDEWRGLYEHGLEDRNTLLARISHLESIVRLITPDEKSQRIAQLQAELAIYKGREEGKQMVIAQLETALRQCNEHRESPYKIVGIVDAALAGMPPYDFTSETACTCDSTLVTDTSNHQPHCPRYVAETKGDDHA